MNTPSRPEESWEDAVRRLAQKARESGVRLVRDVRDGRHYASSVSMPGHWHYLTGVSCDCQGFITHGKCMHHSALMLALGWVSPDCEPDPDPEPMLIECPECRGLGEVQGTRATGPTTFVFAWESCWCCNGVGKVRPLEQDAA